MRTLARVGTLALLAAALVAGCSSSSDDSAGSGGSGATSSGGKAGHAGTSSAGDAGASTSGSGGTSTGGTSTTSNAGAAEGGEAGMGASSLCGNGKLDPGEECDDGNTKEGDGCSSTCKSKCELCESKLCSKRGGNPNGDDAIFDTCYGASGDAPAAGGPAAGIAKAQLCQAVVACVRKSQCAQAFWGLPLTSCYCGAAAIADCKTAPLGPCVEEIAAASESRSYDDIARFWTNTNYASGAAGSLITRCDQPACASECFEDQTPTQCQKCAEGPDPFDYNVTCDYAACYVAGATATGDPSNQKMLSMSLLCAPAAECALRTKCALNGVDTCYGNGAGPCASEFAAAADSTDAATVVNRMHNFSYPASVAFQLLGCEAASCATDCFPSAGSGGGGSGGSNSGGASAGTGGAGTGGGGTGGGGTGGAAAGTGGGGTGGATAGTGGGGVGGT